METKFRVRNKKTKEIIGYEWIDKSGNWKHQYIGEEIIFDSVFDFTGNDKPIREQYTGLKGINERDCENHIDLIMKYNTLSEIYKELEERNEALLKENSELKSINETKKEIL